MFGVGDAVVVGVGNLSLTLSVIDQLFFLFICLFNFACQLTYSTISFMFLMSSGIKWWMSVSTGYHSLSISSNSLIADVLLISKICLVMVFVAGVSASFPYLSMINIIINIP